MLVSQYETDLSRIFPSLPSWTIIFSKSSAFVFIQFGESLALFASVMFLLSECALKKVVVFVRRSEESRSFSEQVRNKRESKILCSRAHARSGFERAGEARFVSPPAAASVRARGSW
jgi:hypothetical protein